MTVIVLSLAILDAVVIAQLDCRPYNHLDLNGTCLSGFRSFRGGILSFRGSGILPRSAAAVGHSSRLEGAPTRRYAFKSVPLILT